MDSVLRIATILSLFGHSVAHADSWRIAGSTNDVRESTGLAILHDGRVLIASGHPATRGRDSRWRIIGSAEVFDPETEQWSLTGPLIEARQGVRQLAVLLDGTVLLAGEHDTKTGAEIYDPASGTWRATAPLNTGRGVHTTTVLNDGRVLVAGGIDYASDPGTVLNSVEIYDPAARSWTRTGDMHSSRFTHISVHLTDGRVLVAGGVSSDVSGAPALSSAEVYDPDAGTWAEIASMSQARKMPSAVLLSDGRVLVAGGTSGNGESQPSTNSAEIYDPSKNIWTAAAPMSEDRTQFVLINLSDRRVMAIAGVSRPRGSALNSIELYDPAIDAWTPAPSLNVRRWNHRAIVLKSGEVLVVGGYNLSGELSSTEIFSQQ